MQANMEIAGLHNPALTAKVLAVCDQVLDESTCVSCSTEGTPSSFS